MPRDPIEALLRIRRLALDEARRALAASLHVEEAAAKARGAAEAELLRERKAAERLDAGDATVEAYAAWLPQARGRLTQAAAVHERSEAETARARAALGVARSAHEAAEDAIARRQDAARAARQKQEQLGLDDAASRLFRKQ